MRAHQNDEKQEGRDDSREEIDGMVALRQTAKKARDRDVIGNECVGFVDQGRRRDQYDYPDDSLRERLAHPERLSVVSAGWQRGGWLRRCRRPGSIEAPTGLLPRETPATIGPFRRSASCQQVSTFMQHPARLQSRARHPDHSSLRYSRTERITRAPSPTAAATPFGERWRTSPAAKTPGRQGVGIAVDHGLATGPPARRLLEVDHRIAAGAPGIKPAGQGPHAFDAATS